MGLIDRFRLRLQFDKGVKSAERADYGEAMLCFQEVIDQDPGYALAHGNLGFCLFELGREDEAISAYQHSLRLDPEDAQCVYDLGCILFKMGRNEAAAEKFEEALRLEPEFPDARVGLRKAQQQLDPDGYQPVPAEEDEPAPIKFGHPESAQSSEPLDVETESTEALIERGHELYENSEHGKALETWRRAMASSPKNASLHNNCAAALFHLGRLDEAVSACNLALAVDPEYTVALMTRAEILLEQGNRKSAQKDLEMMRALDAEMAESLAEMIESHQS
jgi:tetratricopeptide (TPR) repeat protein